MGTGQHNTGTRSSGAGLHRVVQQIPEGPDQIHIAHRQPGAERDLCPDLHAAYPGRLDLVVQKSVDNGVFADAQRGVAGAGFQLGEIGGGLAAAAALQETLHGVQMVCNVVAHTADTFVLGGQVGIVLFLGLHQAGKHLVFRLELGLLGDVPNGKKDAHIGDNDSQNRDDKENDPALILGGPDGVQPAEHEQILADGENGEQKPVPAAQFKFGVVAQQPI